MWNLEGCPRCGGDIYIDKSDGRWYQQCLQCGYEREMEGIVEARKPLVKKGEPAKAVRA